MSIDETRPETHGIMRRIEIKFGGHVHVVRKINTREQSYFYVAYLLPEGVENRPSLAPESLGALAWSAADSPEHALKKVEDKLNSSR